MRIGCFLIDKFTLDKKAYNEKQDVRNHLGSEDVESQHFMEQLDQGVTAKHDRRDQEIVAHKTALAAAMMLENQFPVDREID